MIIHIKGIITKVRGFSQITNPHSLSDLICCFSSRMFFIHLSITFKKQTAQVHIVHLSC